MQRAIGDQVFSDLSLPRVKICGLKDPISVRMAVRYGADAVGFITEVPVNTPRKIDRQTARNLVAATPPLVTTVMVCMPDDKEHALELIEYVRPDAVQVHSSMSIEELQGIKRSVRLKLITTVHITQDTDVDKTLEYISELENTADAILLDTKVDGKTGGTGVVHDWTISRAITAGSKLPIILAGGLNPNNVAEAVRTVRPYAVDTASGVETGRNKDEEKVKAFIEQAQGHSYD
ncbi:MAG: phosphoribosylanthranilate isomerase [ANME-2 cluster archaeon]|nr:phosphoribosylanthranilate isomerase [ANME-2 cluster archaeon]